MTPTIKAMYKAVTTRKEYIVMIDLSTNYTCCKYVATNNIDKYVGKDNTIILCTEDRDDNIDLLLDLYFSMLEDSKRYALFDICREYELTPRQVAYIDKLAKG